MTWNCSPSFPWVSFPKWLSFYLSPSNIFSWIDPGHALLGGNDRNAAELFLMHLIKRRVMTYLITSEDNLDRPLGSARYLHWSHHFPFVFDYNGEVLWYSTYHYPVCHHNITHPYRYPWLPPHASTTTMVTQIVMINFPHFYCICRNEKEHSLLHLCVYLFQYGLMVLLNSINFHTILILKFLYH